MVPTVRYPAGVVPPAGRYHVLAGRIPMLTYRSPDDTAVFHLMGGMSIPTTEQPEAIRLLELKGLVPPWQAIEQKGATQDGASFIDALYDPIEVGMVVEAVGKDPKRTRQLIRDWVAAWDAKQPGELSFFDHYAGRWWTKVRLANAPTDKIRGGTFTRQKFTWAAKAYDGFWRSYDHTDQFAFSYADTADDFEVDDPDDLGDDWTLAFSGSGSGALSVADGQVNNTFADERIVVARRDDYTATTNNQLAEIELGTFESWGYPQTAYNDVWVRMANSGTPGDDGVRLRITRHSATVSYFVSGVETVMRQISGWRFPAPRPGQKFALIAGQEGNENAYKVVRTAAYARARGTTVLDFTYTGVPTGSGYRSVGFGMARDEDPGSFWITDGPPAGVRSWTAGDNSTVSQGGFLKRINVGYQPMWDRYLCIGPGTFRFGNGPYTNDMVQFGPIEAGQVVQIRTDPRKRAVIDLTAIQPTPQEQTRWLQVLNDFLSFAGANNVSLLESEIESAFGVVPPQGNLYRLLDGRFSRPIPPKPSAGPPEVQYVKVEIDDGNADSRVIVAGTPLRRWPY